MYTHILQLCWCSVQQLQNGFILFLSGLLLSSFNFVHTVPAVVLTAPKKTDALA